jgi:hypothetical protein
MSGVRARSRCADSHFHGPVFYLESTFGSKRWAPSCSVPPRDPKSAPCGLPIHSRKAESGRVFTFVRGYCARGEYRRTASLLVPLVMAAFSQMPMYFLFGYTGHEVSQKFLI